VEVEVGEMRPKRTILVLVTAVGVLAWPVEAASANGGSYLELDRAHYLPGEHGTAVTYVTVPERKESIFDLGPFYLFALSEGMSLREDRPIPSAAVRIGTFAIEEEKHQYELTADFTVPQLAGDFYSLEVCNDPCTVSGFREALGGSISIVATQREAELLTQQSRLYNRVYRLRSDIRQAERRLEKARTDFELQLANGRADRDELTSRIEELERALAASQERAADAARTPFEPWVVGAIAALIVGAGILLLRRRRILPAITDL
jgi:hypothetical protein